MNEHGAQAVEALKLDVEKVSATGKTADSIRFEVVTVNFKTTLRIYGRKYFKALETGRGPRTSGQYQEYDISMYEYLQARGIGADLPEKKRKQLAKFMAYKINKEGDLTFKKGGRIVYSPTLTKLIAELKEALKRDFVKTSIKSILNGNNGTG